MLGENLANCRIAAHMTQQALADALGVSKNTVFSWEKGIRKPDIDMLGRIATFFNTSTDRLIGKEQSTIPDDDDIKFALFGVDPAHITDEQFEEVKRFAKFVREQQLNKKD